MYGKRPFLALVLMCIAGAISFSETKTAEKAIEERLSLSVFADTAIPVFGDGEYFNIGFGGTASFEFQIVPFFSPLLHGGIHIIPVSGFDPLSLMEVGLGTGFTFRPTDRIILSVDALGGVYTSRWDDYGASGIFFGFRGDGGYRVSPAIILSLHGGFSDYLNNPEPLLRSINAGVSVNIQFSKLGNTKANADIEFQNIDPIFPVFYSFYDENAFASINVTNGEETKVTEMSVSVFIPEYMSQPRQCAGFETVEVNETVSVPLYALLNDEVLELTENSRGQAEIIVEYRLLGFKRKTVMPVKLSMYHRNAMTWDDDRKAAAFVSPTDPAVLWFSRYAAGIVRNRMRGDINKNLQLGMGMFEALRLYGLNYVIDPNSSYIELSENAEFVDYLQFPYQTLFFRGGDCDDLSILYSALMESIGIRTAFITIPGHIYMAFDLGVSEDEARESFYDPSMLIFRDGEAWAPLEITMVREGFLKAWRIGAKEWVDNVTTGNAVLYPMSESWEKYRPVSIPNVNPRFSLPRETDLVRTFDTSMNRYVAREIQPLKERLVRAGAENDPEGQNELGILYGRYGMLNEAWDQFSASAKAGYQLAWVNLGNIAFLQKDYELAVSYYNWALKLKPDDSLALLGVARSQYELENLRESDAAYTELKTLDSELASDYGYLASLFEGEGRAWSFTERLSKTVWAEPEETFPDIRPAEEGTLAMGLKEARIVDDEDIYEPPPAEADIPAVEDDSREEIAEVTTDETGPVEEAAEAGPAAEGDPVPSEDQQDDSQTVTGEEEPGDTDTPEEEPSDSEPEESIPEDREIESAPEVKIAAEDSAPPVIEDVLPEDRELKEKKSAETVETAAIVVEEETPADAPPLIAEEVPEDRELAEKTEVEERESASAEAAPESADEVAVSAAADAEDTEPEPAPPVNTDDDYIAALLDSELPEDQGPSIAEPAEEEPAVAEEEVSPEPEPEKPEQPAAPADEKEPVEIAMAAEDAAADREKSSASVPITLKLEEEFEEDTLVETFRGGKAAIGSWKISKDKVIQNDKEQLYAKLVLPAGQNSQITKYSFTAQSTGSGWTGLGIHIFRDHIVTNMGYGAGNSILIWLTSDPKHNADDATYLQIYRSYSDTRMEMLESVKIADSIFNLNRYDIIFNKIKDIVTVKINDTNRLELSGFSDFNNGEFVVFRTLDTAAFEDFSMEVLRWKGNE